MFYFRSSLFKGGAKNDAKLRTNFETCNFFRRFFKLFFFEDPLGKSIREHSSLCSARSLGYTFRRHRSRCGGTSVPKASAKLHPSFETTKLFTKKFLKNYVF